MGDAILYLETADGFILTLGILVAIMSLIFVLGVRKYERDVERINPKKRK
jgi:hypothetical protein